MLPRPTNATGGSAAARSEGARGCVPAARAPCVAALPRIDGRGQRFQALETGGGRARRMRHDACVFLEGGARRENENPCRQSLMIERRAKSLPELRPWCFLVAHANRHHGSQPSSNICPGRGNACVSSANNTQTEQPPPARQKSISPNLKAKLLQEAESPWRTVRKFIYGASRLRDGRRPTGADAVAPPSANNLSFTAGADHPECGGGFRRRRRVRLRREGRRRGRQRPRGGRRRHSCHD